ncbi:hypothetical protein Y032_0077g1091 [Ancylostoma ceylanicum]|uniref:Uncharacterized protein n=1 Tax=Ancylostoma ceylanicum TaxID=53326 RepID=A0A016TUA3_9BILA|nr:hypothetical protein Y032_0077g1091 [Ancylostoma ceylanicum]
MFLSSWRNCKKKIKYKVHRLGTKIAMEFRLLSESTTTRHQLTDVVLIARQLFWFIRPITSPYSHNVIHTMSEKIKTSQ